MTKDYFNRMSAHWDDMATEKNQVKLERLAHSLDIEPGSTVLDVGTGTGVFIPFLLKKIGNNGKLVCVDSAEEMLKKAMAKKFSGNIGYVCTDISNTQFQNTMFDTVVCYSSFPHFHDKIESLREINRVLKTGGRLYIGHTSNRSTINNIHSQVPVLINDLIPDNGEMRKMMSEAGFSDITILEDHESYLARAKKLNVV